MLRTSKLIVRKNSRLRRIFCLFLVVYLSTSLPVNAYIGPGAGVAFVSSFLVVIVTFLLAFLTIVTWPLRWMIHKLRGRIALGKSRVRRVVILGLDGQDPQLTEKFLEEGDLPNFSRLRRD